MEDSGNAVAGAFRRLAESPEIDLFEGALLVSLLVDSDSDLVAARARVGELARKVSERRRAGDDGISALREVLFEVEGFRGDSEQYDEPPNCSVAHALQSRRGMPITLSILAIEVGRRAGLSLEGVGLPGHFVVAGAELPEGQFLDPFRGGVLCDADDLTRRVGETFGAEVELAPDVFAPDPPRVILRRVLSNLRRSYEKRHRFEEALAVLECAEALDPDDPGLRRERGLLLLRMGRPGEGVAALESYLGDAPEEDADALRRLVRVVREQSGDPGAAAERKVFTLQEARTLLPRIRERTSDAVSRYARLPMGAEAEAERQTILREWASEIARLGVEIKGPWLVDFDSGAGYYCWKYPERGLEYFHGYEEGFAGRVPLQ